MNGLGWPYPESFGQDLDISVQDPARLQKFALRIYR